MKHCIIVKYKENVSAERKESLIPKIQELFDKTKEIKGIRKITLKPNVIDRPNRYDLVIEMDMEESALPVYDDCVWHKEWKEKYGELLSAKTIIDLAE